ncbi:MAG: hypothetical protein PHQ98_02585 [Candidatus ainarchaeum sp.]|nr:hypothetical protein [Candidatus ainarchaeum sp.]
MRLNEASWNFFLDEFKNDLIIIKYFFSLEENKVLEFVIIYASVIDEKLEEIVKYDVSQKEQLHVHYYKYKQFEVKKFLNNEVSFQTMWEIVEYLKENWRILKLKFLD